MGHRGIKVYRYYCIEGYSGNIPLIIGDDRFGKSDYTEATRPLAIITVPGPGSSRMAACPSQSYHENKRRIKAEYARFEAFPIWNLPLEHPINLAYRAATADLSDVNIIDPFRLEAYGKTAVNHNRDMDILPVLNAIFEGIYGTSPYKSPTDMGVNVAGFCIIDDEAYRGASYQGITHRHCHTLNRLVKEGGSSGEVYKINLPMNQARITTTMRRVITPRTEWTQQLGSPAVAMELEDGQLVTGKTSTLLGASAALLLNAIKVLGNTHHDVCLVAPSIMELIQVSKVQYMGSKDPRLHTDEVLITLLMSAAADDTTRKALSRLPKLRGCQVHTFVMLSDMDIKVSKKLDVKLTSKPVCEHRELYH